MSKLVRTECAICGWNTPCHDDGEAYICADSDMCKILQELNETRRELAAARAVVEAARELTIDRGHLATLHGISVVRAALAAYDDATKGGKS